MVSKDSIENTITVCEGTQHPALFSHRLIMKDIHWIDQQIPESLALVSLQPSRGSALITVSGERCDASTKYDTLASPKKEHCDYCKTPKLKLYVTVNHF